MLDAFGIFNRYNDDANLDLKFGDLFYDKKITLHNFEHTAVELRKIYKRNRVALEKALNKDSERRYFPIELKIIFTQSSSDRSLWELEEFSFLDKNRHMSVWPTIYFRQKIKKLNNNYEYHVKTQDEFHKALKMKKFDCHRSTGIIVTTRDVYSKSYTSIVDFEKDVRSFEKALIQNF